METSPFSAGYEEAIARGDAKGLKNSQICATENTVHQLIYNLASTGNWWRYGTQPGDKQWSTLVVWCSTLYSYSFSHFPMAENGG